MRLNDKFLYFYFGNHLLILATSKQFLLNEYQAKVLELVSKGESFNRISEFFVKSIESVSRDEIEVLLIETINLFRSMNILIDKQDDKNVPIYGEFNKYYPKKVIIELTSRCHLSCVHCFKEAGPMNKNFINISSVMTFLKSMKGKIKEIQLTGGEPMLHPNFEQIVRYVSKEFEEVSITTTGHFINENNINLFKSIDFLQLSLYTNDSVRYDRITNKRDSLKSTLKAISLLNKNNIDFAVSAIASKYLLDRFDEYINFLIQYEIKDVRFGLYSKLGRGVKVDLDWLIDKTDIMLFSDLLVSKQKEYEKDIYIHTWEEDRCTSDYFIPNNNMMRCGAGVLEWTLTEKGIIKPCSFFPDYLNKNTTLENIEEYVLFDHSSEISEQINKWESSLNSVGLSTRNICEEIHRMVREYEK